MANEKKRRRRVRLSRRANATFTLAVLLILFVGAMVLASQAKGLSRQEKQRQAYLLQIEQAQDTKEQLEQLLSYVTSDEYKRSIARDQLGLLAPNEIRFIPAN